MRLKRQYVRTLPIPVATDTQKSEIANLAETCQQAAEESHLLQGAFGRRILDLADGGDSVKLTDKLKGWQKLEDFSVFRNEIRKALKAEIPLRERSEWEAFFTEERAKLQELSARLTSLKAELNAKVYALFDLTPDEITLLEPELEVKI